MMIANDGSAWIKVGVLHALERSISAIIDHTNPFVLMGFRLGGKSYQVLFKVKEPKVTQAANIEPAL